MAETELDVYPLREPRRLHLEWLLPMIFRPARTLREIFEAEKPSWLTPLVLLSLLALVMVVAGGPVRVQAAQIPAEPPEDFQWWSPEQLEQYFQNQAGRAGPLFTYVFPAVRAVGGLWVGWFLLGALLHLGLTLAGSRSSSTNAFNLAAWASVPFAIRYLVQTVYIFATHQLIEIPGLSGLLLDASARLPLFARLVLAGVDLYVIWRLALLLVGVNLMSNLPRARAAVITLAVVVILLALQALPSFGLSQISGLSTVRPFFFF
jgi:hypothetical protein